jgi:hypothetical protein
MCLLTGLLHILGQTSDLEHAVDHNGYMLDPILQLAKVLDLIQGERKPVQDLETISTSELSWEIGSRHTSLTDPLSVSPALTIPHASGRVEQTTAWVGGFVWSWISVPSAVL